MSTVNEFTFGEQLSYSQDQDVEATLRQLFPAAVNVYKSTPAEDRQGIDYWVVMPSRRALGVDMKVRSRDYAVSGHDDLALESWSVVEAGIPGWTRDLSKRTDFVVYLWPSTGRASLLPFVPLATVFDANWTVWRGMYKTTRQRTTRRDGSSYHSETVFVPRRVVWTALYKHYSGDPKLVVN